MNQSGEETSKANEILELMDKELVKKKEKISHFKRIILQQEKNIEESSENIQILEKRIFNLEKQVSEQKNLNSNIENELEDQR